MKTADSARLSFLLCIHVYEHWPLETNSLNISLLLANTHPAGLQGIAQLASWNWQTQSDWSTIFCVYGYLKITWIQKKLQDPAVSSVLLSTYVPKKWKSTNFYHLEDDILNCIRRPYPPVYTVRVEEAVYEYTPLNGEHRAQHVQGYSGQTVPKQ